MSLNNFNKTLIQSEIVLWIRRKILLLCFLGFAALNWGHSLGAIRASFTLTFMYQMSGAKQAEVSQWLVSPNTYENLGYTIASFAIVYVIGLTLVWYIDGFGLKRSLRDPEYRHLRRDVRREKRDLIDKKKSLEDEKRLILTLDHAQALKEYLVETAKRTEAIIQRYEHNAQALNPDILKRPKLSDKDETIVDLFDEQTLEGLKRPAKRRKTLHKFKTKP